MTPPKMARRFARWLAPALTPAQPIRVYVPRWLARTREERAAARTVDRLIRATEKAAAAGRNPR